MGAGCTHISVLCQGPQVFVVAHQLRRDYSCETQMPVADARDLLPDDFRAHDAGGAVRTDHEIGVEAFSTRKRYAHALRVDRRDGGIVAEFDALARRESEQHRLEISVLHENEVCHEVDEEVLV
jgi:hypothetical protein